MVQRRRKRMAARRPPRTLALGYPSADHCTDSIRSRDLIDLVTLAALWGASFLFMRHGAPAFGPIALVQVRVTIAAAVLTGLLLLRGERSALRAHAPALGFVGVMNSALPFVLFTYA